MPGKRGRPKKDIAESIDSSSDSPDEEDEEETKALDVLNRIRHKLEEIGDPTYKMTKPLYPSSDFTSNFQKDMDNKTKDDNMDDSTDTNAPNKNCALCLSSLKNGEIVALTPCCGSFCHVTCLAQISEGMVRACPNCMTAISQEQQQKYVMIAKLLKS